MSAMIRIMIADDHPLFLDGLVATMSADGEMEVVGTAGDAAFVGVETGERARHFGLTWGCRVAASRQRDGSRRRLRPRAW